MHWHPRTTTTEHTLKQHNRMSLTVRTCQGAESFPVNTVQCAQRSQASLTGSPSGGMHASAVQAPCLGVTGWTEPCSRTGPAVVFRAPEVRIGVRVYTCKPQLRGHECHSFLKRAVCQGKQPGRTGRTSESEQTDTQDIRPDLGLARPGNIAE